LAPESRRKISMVPGGQEVVRLCDSSGARSAGGRLFQMVAQLTAKLCCPATVRMHGTSTVQAQVLVLCQFSSTVGLLDILSGQCIFMTLHKNLLIKTCILLCVTVQG